jgi:hypothetical protein
MHESRQLTSLRCFGTSIPDSASATVDPAIAPPTWQGLTQVLWQRVTALVPTSLTDSLVLAVPKRKVSLIHQTTARLLF